MLGLGAHLHLVALVVREYQPAIDFFVKVLHFELVEDVPSLTNDGRPKRWVVVRPAGAATGILMVAAGVDFVSPPRAEAYGQVAVFLDLEGFDRFTIERFQQVQQPHCLPRLIAV